MLTRKAVTVSAAASLALAAFAVPAVNAQDADGPAGGAESGSISMGSLEGGSNDSGSLGAGSGEGLGGSLGSAGSEDSSVGDLAPPSDKVCELPDLGGSVAKFYPLFGVSGVPSGVLDLIATALGDFPNLLDMVGGAGSGESLLGEAGSLEGPLCSSILGGQMVTPPVTVIVDGDGNPITTVTGTVAPNSSTSTSTPLASSSGSTVAGGSAGNGDPDPDVLSTSVPTSGSVG